MESGNEELLETLAVVQFEICDQPVIFQVLTAASMKMTVFWVVAPCCYKFTDGSWRWALMMEAASTSEMSVNLYQTARCYNPEDRHLV
jgi:hypothetical protein